MTVGSAIWRLGLAALTAVILILLVNGPGRGLLYEQQYLIPGDRRDLEHLAELTKDQGWQVSQSTEIVNGIYAVTIERSRIRLP